MTDTPTDLSPAMAEVRRIMRHRQKGLITAAEAIHDLGTVFPRLTQDEKTTLRLALIYTEGAA